jgi:hypothetical protein
MKEVAPHYVVRNWSGVPEEYPSAGVEDVFEGPQREFIKFITAY